MIPPFTAEDFKRQKRQALTHLFQGGFGVVFYLVFWALIKKPVESIVAILFGVTCAAGVMLVGIGLALYRTACIRRALTEFPGHSLWNYTSFNTLMYGPSFVLKTLTWKGWEKWLKESE